jgi:hypothetical protein
MADKQNNKRKRFSSSDTSHETNMSTHDIAGVSNNVSAHLTSGEPTPPENASHIIIFPTSPVGKAIIKGNAEVLRATHHISVATEFQIAGSYPKGLTIKISPQVPTKPATFLLQWEEAVNDCSIQLNKLLLEYWKSHKELVAKEYDELMSKKEGTSKDEQERIDLALTKQALDFNNPAPQKWKPKKQGLRKNIAGFFQKKNTRKD